jgi:alcohol dehydrogenase class IV
VVLLLAKQAGPGDFLLAIGGGAAIDLAKAAAAMATQVESQDVRDYLEGVGHELSIGRDPLPILAMPTTGGTGSEATRNAVISSLDPPYKKSLRSERLLPRAVIVDPEFAVSLPPLATAHAGMDAITQLIESFVSRRAQPVTDALCLAALPEAIESLPVAYADGTNRAAREAMAHAALMSGMALANSGLGVAHAVAAALGVHAGVPHGLACAMMLPAALEVNRSVCEAKLAQIGELITGRTYSLRSAAADATIECVDRLIEILKIPRRLSELGVHREQLPALVRGSHGNSLNGNPRELSDDELYNLLEQMF